MRQANPSRADLNAAVDKKLRDVIASDLKVLFCGINPGLYSAWSGHHFARPGNRFWPALHAGGFTKKLLHPSEQRLLLDDGYGITNLVERASATADQLAADEIVAGGKRLSAKVKSYRPRYLAVVGMGAYRTAFARPKAKLGMQDEALGATKVWVLPNPSGLNAHYQASELATLFRQLREAVEADLLI